MFKDPIAQIVQLGAYTSACSYWPDDGRRWVIGAVTCSYRLYTLNQGDIRSPCLKGNSSTTQQVLVGDTEKAAETQPKSRVSLQTWLQQQKEDTRDDVALSTIKDTKKRFKMVRQRLSDCQRYGKESYVAEVQQLLRELETLCTLMQTAPPYPWSKAIKAGNAAGSKVKYEVDIVLSQEVWHLAFSDDNRRALEIEAIIELVSLLHTQPLEMAHRDFAQDFKDVGTVDYLRKTIREHNYLGDANLPGPVMAVLQSPGTGKSRTVLQLCTQELGLYVSLETKKVLSIPPVDNDVNAVLTSRNLLEDQADALHTVASWLAACLDRFADFCEQKMQADRMEIESPEHWSRFVKRVATVLNDEIVPGYRALGRLAGLEASASIELNPDNSMKQRAALVRPALLAETRNHLIRHSDQRVIPWDILPSHLFYYARKLQHIAQRFKRLRKNQPGFAFVALDHAMSLGRIRLKVLRQLMQLLRGHDLWVILIDCDHVMVGKTVEPVYSFRWLCHTEYGVKVLNPFVSMLPDIFVSDNIEYVSLIGGDTIQTHREWLGYLTRMGQPLWNGEYWRKPVSRSGTQALGISLLPVLEKLLGRFNFGQLLFDGTNEQMQKTHGAKLLALIGQRVPINLIGSQGKYPILRLWYSGD